MRGSGLFLILPSIWPCCLISSRNTFTFYDGEFHGEYFEYLGAKKRDTTNGTGLWEMVRGGTSLDSFGKGRRR